jgi:acetate kinase
MRVLVVNTGSSSVKLTLLDGDDTVLARATLAAGAAQREGEQLAAAIAKMPAPDAVGHRVVHGGAELTAPVLIDAGVTRRLHALTDLAPLHQPPALAAIGATARALPDLPAVACFDTAFHTTIPAAATTYAIPERWRRSHGVRRYGFHGLSHAYASRRAVELTGHTGDTGGAGDPRDSRDSRIVVAHLGAGASLAAVRGGRCVDTTMGFTPLEGLVMATRSGSLDPGILLWLLNHGSTPAELTDALEHHSGLLALAGTPDMRRIIAAADTTVDRKGNGEGGGAAAGAGERARLALEVYLHRLRAGIGAMTATLGGLDTLVFTGGIGEHQPVIRAGCAAGLGFLGVAIDGGANRGAQPDADTDISAPGAAARTLVIAAREDLEIAALVRRTLAGEQPA